jgi:predicted ATPase
MAKIKQLSIRGFKSIQSQDITFEQINLLIGGNGAGKSNLIALFRMLNYMLTDGLQNFVAQEGFANSLLYMGAGTTPQMEIKIIFDQEGKASTYSFRLAHGAKDVLVFLDETIEFQRPEFKGPKRESLGAGHRESMLKEEKAKGNKTASVLVHFLSQCRAYQFHDTSKTALVRQYSRVADNRFLYSNGGNLASFLYALSQSHLEEYENILGAIRHIVPTFGAFELKPARNNTDMISLQWLEHGSSYLFGPHQLPDGLLRFICLATLLLQPQEDLPDVIIIDEPELGLHPAALTLVAAFFKKVSLSKQIIVATQSSTLLDQFTANEIIVVERVKQMSTFRRLNEEDLKDWTSEYSIGELWQKNVLGGRP